MMIYYKINKKIKAIKLTTKDNNIGLKLLIENHKTENNNISLFISKKDFNKLIKVLEL